MGANDAREQLEVAKAECVRLERELAELKQREWIAHATVEALTRTMGERDAALAVIAEVREALAPGRPVYASLSAARAALEKVAN